jgi:hypothetical protein
MKTIAQATRNWVLETATAWDRFWFTPTAPHTLAAIRILAGAMLFYTHLVWSLDLAEFFGPRSWISLDVVRAVNRDSYAWSYLWYIESPIWLWLVHCAALVVFALLTVGLFTRWTSILSAVITLSYCHRLPGVLFGLDQVNALLAMYLAVGPCGAVYSIDYWRAARRGGQGGVIRNSVGATVATRLIQLHMCIIYLFGGIGKMRGEMWWDGSALWYAIANYEYQSLDLTWLVRFPWLIAVLTHITVFWETFYAFLVWPRQTRPIVLGLAVLIHGGIALFLGMPTFGIAMIIGNLAFVSSETMASWVSAIADRWPRILEKPLLDSLASSRK